jgi:hypothetical protein
MEKVQGGGAAAACVTVNVCPATVIVPVRDAPVFAAMLNPTVPVPVPLAPDVTVIHGALLVAFHVQVLAVVTVTLPCDAPATTESPADESANVH